MIVATRRMNRELELIKWGVIVVLATGLALVVATVTGG
jgi:hypothetical protein